MYINWFTWMIFFMIVYVIQKNGGNKNSPNYLNVMIYYHYHGKNRVINRLLPSMIIGHTLQHTLLGRCQITIELLKYLLLGSS